MYIIAGANGAGKTTAAFNLLPDVFETVEFVNADEIARGLSPLNFEGVTFQAARIMLERLNELVKGNKSFAFETTLSGLTYLSFIEKAKEQGYEIILFFIWLESVELAKSRVAARVLKGGHNIPVEIIKRRYEKGVKNFNRYTKIVDDWYIFNNSGPGYELVAREIDSVKEIFNFDICKKIIGS